MQGQNFDHLPILGKNHFCNWSYHDGISSPAGLLLLAIHPHKTLAINASSISTFTTTELDSLHHHGVRNSINLKWFRPLLQVILGIFCLIAFNLRLFFPECIKDNICKKKGGRGKFFGSMKGLQKQDFIREICRLLQKVIKRLKIALNHTCHADPILRNLTCIYTIPKRHDR